MVRKAARLSDRGRRTRQEILDAAIEVFGEAGETRTSLAEIGRRCGRSSQAIYRYFPDRRTLFEAAVRQEDDRYDVELRARIVDVRYPHFGNAYWPAAFEILPRYPLLMRIYRSGDPRDLDLLLDGPRSVERVRELAAELRLGQTAKVIRQDVDVEEIASAVYRIAVQVLLPRALATHSRSADVAAIELVLRAAVFSPLPDLRTAKARQAFGRELMAALDAAAG